VVTEIDWVVAPVDHKYELPALDVGNTSACAKVVDPLVVMLGVAGAAFTVTLSFLRSTLAT
jgi:hypothetical protein